MNRQELLQRFNDHYVSLRAALESLTTADAPEDRRKIWAEIKEHEAAIEELFPAPHDSL
jgi:hypothetical protein